jgi:hypothetical protein
MGLTKAVHKVHISAILFPPMIWITTSNNIVAVTVGLLTTTRSSLDPGYASHVIMKGTK